MVDRTRNNRSTRVRVTAWLGGIYIALSLLGCNRNQPYLVGTPSGFTAAPAPGSLNGAMPAAATAYSAQVAELERRAKLLDDNNRQLHTQLAQSQQQMQLFKDRSDLMQRQLQDVSTQLQQARIASTRTAPAPNLNDQIQSMQAQRANTPATTTKKSGARLTANSSSRLSSDGLRSLGYEVLNEGSVIRMRIPADQLFQSNSAQLTPSASSILDRVAESIKSDYAQQRVAVEGHTDNGPIYGGNYSTSHQLASAQTNAVFEYLTRRNQLPTAQLFTLAHGANYPISDNQSPVARSANRRIEFVIYPETF